MAQGRRVGRGLAAAPGGAVLAGTGRAIVDVRSFSQSQPGLLRLALEGEIAIGLRVSRAREPASQVLSDVASQKDGRAGAAVLPHVSQLVGEKARAIGCIRKDERRRRRGEEHPPAEDDRIGAGQRRQDPREKARVEPGANEFAGESGAQELRRGGRNPISEQTMSRPGSFAATRSASAPPCK